MSQGDANILDCSKVCEYCSLYTGWVLKVEVLLLYRNWPKKEKLSLVVCYWGAIYYGCKGFSDGTLMCLTKLTIRGVVWFLENLCAWKPPKNCPLALLWFKWWGGGDILAEKDYVFC